MTSVTPAPSVSVRPSYATGVAFSPTVSPVPSVSVAPTLSISPSAFTYSPSISSYPTESLGAPQSFGPTHHPTPGVPFVYRAEGDSSFGYRWQDEYSLAHQLAVRRPGWSWGDLTSGSAPFCFQDKCYNVTAVCEAFAGDLLHESVCSFPEDVKIAGPSCWRGACTSQGEKACKDAGGTTIGELDGSGGPQWCILKGEVSMIGPMCYGPDCFTEETKEACSAAKGSLWNDNYCFVSGYYTPVGPICWDNFCVFGDAKSKCESLGGSVFAQRWCLLPGCDRTVIGPTCSAAPIEPDEQCFQHETASLCTQLKGTQIGNRFCVLDGTDWTFIGPTVYQQTETIGPTNNFCQELKGGLSDYFNFMDSYEIAGRFCLVKQRIPTTTPFCTDSGCDTEMGRKFCERFDGKTLGGGFMCSLCDAYRQVVGPLMWNGTLLQGNPQFCEGPFCAVPHGENPATVNLRCPLSEPLVTRCGAFGGARGFSGADGNSTNFGEDELVEDDADAEEVKESSKASGSVRALSALLLSSVLVWTAQSIDMLR